MLEHKISTYKDGYKVVIFCRVCGQEEPNVYSTCPGKVVDKILDKKQEQS